MSSSCSSTVGIQPMLASTMTKRRRGKRCGMPEKTSWAATGMVWEPAFDAPAPAMNPTVERFIFPAARPSSLKLPMWTPRGVSDCWARSQNGSLAGPRVEAPRADRLVAIPLGAELEVGQAGRRGEAERTQALAVVEGPHVAGLGAQHLRGPGAEALRHA